MHAVKGAWVGQTFALAKGNDYSGRKSRIRRSKEERKEMVESFIKTYQIANNGSFPSLNLTHKEVGGSFYIVREIVREIIQENRVLGPAKLITEELDRSGQLFLDTHPLGSISVEPEILLQVQSNGSHLVSDYCRDELNESSSNELPVGSELQEFYDRSVINGSQVSMEDETSEAKTISMEVGVSENLEEQKHGEVLEASSKATPLAAEVGVGEHLVEQKRDEVLEASYKAEAVAAETGVGEHLVEQKPGEVVEASSKAETIAVELGVSEHMVEQKPGEVVEESSKGETVSAEIGVNKHLVEQKPGEVSKHLVEQKPGEVVEASSKAESIAVELGVSERMVEQKPGEVEESSKGETVSAEIGVNKHLVEQKPGEVEALSAASQLTAGVIVETFPIRPVDKLAGSVEGSSTGAIKRDRSLKQNDNGKLDDLDSSNNSSLEAEKRGAKVDSSLKDYDSVNRRVEKVLEPPQKISDHLAKPTTTARTSDNNVAVRSVMSDQDILTSWSGKSNRAIAREDPNFPKTISQKHLDDAFSRSQSLNQKEGRGGNKTSDRTYLKPQGAPQAKGSAAAQQETNPLWIIFKSFVESFVKFWSE